jgi:hypothetical protein
MYILLYYSRSGDKNKKEAIEKPAPVTCMPPQWDNKEQLTAALPFLGKSPPPTENSSPPSGKFSRTAGTLTYTTAGKERWAECPPPSHTREKHWKILSRPRSWGPQAERVLCSAGTSHRSKKAWLRATFTPVKSCNSSSIAAVGWRGGGWLSQLPFPLPPPHRDMAAGQKYKTAPTRPGLSQWEARECRRGPAPAAAQLRVWSGSSYRFVWVNAARSV